MRLNLGCGSDIKQGYVNVDFRQTHPAVMKVDLSVFPWPFEDSSADEILMLDFLEHFPYAQTTSILREVHRILKPGGEVQIQVPDFEELSAAIEQRFGGLGYHCNQCGYLFDEDDAWSTLASCPKCKTPLDAISDAAVARLFGGQDYPGNYHQVTFTQHRLTRLCRENGLRIREWMEEDHQRLNWNFKGRFIK